MPDILQEIVAHKREEVAQAKRLVPPEVLRARLQEQLAASPRCVTPSLRRALLSSPTGILAEMKRRSPSRGWINREARPELVPLAYERAGAAALSILTDRDYFGGDDSFVRLARESGVGLPVLYKNFVVDEYQLMQARACGASAVLLIAACLSLERCGELMASAHALGLEVLLEMHSEAELRYAELGPDVCGINNRHLGTFTTTVETSLRLAPLLPAGGCWVSESGIRSPQVALELRSAGFRGFLIGERFMREADPGAALAAFIEGMTGAQSERT